MLKIAFDQSFILPLPEGHRFPMAKYELLPQQLLYEGTVKEENFFVPEIDASPWISQTHQADYLERLVSGKLSKAEIRRSGFPWSKEMVEREFLLAAGTVQATEFALNYGLAMNIAGGTHHAYSDRGEGFCLLNDQAIAAQYLIQEKGFTRVLILDLDVHQGNGTAEIFQNEDRVFTFSMHGEKNYPMHKEKSDLDVACPDGMEDAAYLALLEEKLSEVLDTFQPEFVFFQSGVDVLASDKLGRLALSMEGCRRRDAMVLQNCFQRSLPVMISMGGGYSENVSTIVNAHANTYRLAQEIYF
ncbi:histone deacetylase [Persicobacter sp. CCB-QB2]|uniref:histone deacetylase family protein n=1 Tax=Persicobacter sp. CCB-QB2 TaxID=1561025 RepID=UPI0006A950FE|nr:histone deacetylase [Persicobacter sp. CCB-QB2]